MRAKPNGQGSVWGGAGPSVRAGSDPAGGAAVNFCVRSRAATAVSLVLLRAGGGRFMEVALDPDTNRRLSPLLHLPAPSAVNQRIPLVVLQAVLAPLLRAPSPSHRSESAKWTQNSRRAPCTAAHRI